MPDPKIDTKSETDLAHVRSVSPYRAGLTCSCPNCGDSPLYQGLLETKDTCDGCGFDLTTADAGDGAQIFVIMILGAISTLLGLFLYSLGLSKWVLLLVLIAFIIGGSIWMLRIFKATLIALQFHYDAGQGTLVDEADKAKSDEAKT